MWKLCVAFLCVCWIPSFGHCAAEDDSLVAARALVKSGNKPAAAGLLERTIGTKSDHASQWLRGYAMLWRGNKREALQQFQGMAKSFPQSSHRANALVMAGYLHDGLGENAKGDWEGVAKDYPRTKEAAEALHCLGHLALRDKNTDLAIQEFKSSAAVTTADPATASDSLIEAGYACISKYWQTSDGSALNDALAIFPKKTTASKTASAQSLTVGSATTTDGSDADLRACMGRGEVYLILGLSDKAATEYRAALDMHPADPYLLGVAQYELGCALYAKRDWASAVSALSAFLDARPGTTLTEKDAQWKQARPGYSAYLVSDPARAGQLSGLELVPTAAYWKAAGLVELKRYTEANAVLTGLAAFPKIKMAPRIADLKQMCGYLLGEGK